MIGQVVSHYKILTKLGEGGMGVVYKAQDTVLDRTVALKFLPPEMIRDDAARQRLLHEARAASTIDHPNIGTIHEVSEVEGRAFIAMAYYEGQDLKAVLDRGPLPISEALAIARQIACGLAKAHSKGIIHRDIKPANILITENQQVKIIDFGLAKLRDRTALTKTGTTIGTVAYMSPEQAHGEPVDQRTDIWALGVVLYEMLTGRHPFAAEYEEAMMYRVLNEDPEFVTKLRPEVPGKLNEIIERSIAKNPARRYQSIDELCVDLEAVSGERAGGRKGVSLFGRLGRRQRKIAGRVFPLALVLISTAVYFLLRGGHGPGPVSIVLLPLVNMAGSEGQEWFTDGMTDALITDLARISGLRVTQRPSAMKYKGADKPASEIASELGVSYVLEGSVVRLADQVKISIRLIDGLTNEYLWADEYTRDFTGLLALQGEVAKTIAGQVQVTLTHEENKLLTQQKIVNPEAYEAYLKGNFFWYKLNRESLVMALQYYERAAEIDSMYAPAYAGIALVWGGRAQMGYVPMQTANREGEWAAARALSLDSTLAEVHYMVAVRRAWGEWKFDLAAQSFEKSISLNPNLAEARAYFSHLLFTLNRPDEAMRQIEQALKLDPFNPLIQSIYAMDLMYVRRYDDVIQLLRKTLAVSPMEPVALSTIRSAYHQKKMYKEALQAWTLSYEAREDREAIEALNRGNAEGGYSRALQSLAEMLIKRSTSSYVTPWQVATLYVRAGMPEEALDWFAKAYDAHDPNMPYLSIDPIFDDMRGNPRFQELLRKIGL